MQALFCPYFWDVMAALGRMLSAFPQTRKTSQARLYQKMSPWTWMLFMGNPSTKALLPHSERNSRASFLAISAYGCTMSQGALLLPKFSHPHPLHSQCRCHGLFREQVERMDQPTDTQITPGIA